jgi:hypothetical protein
MITEKEAFNTEFKSLKGAQCLVWWKCGGFLKSIYNLGLNQMDS